MSLFGEYIKERSGKYIFENEHGFISFVVNDDNVYIEDAYIKPEKRTSGEARKLCDQVFLFAKDIGKKIVYTSIVPRGTKGATISMKACLSYGFELDSAANNFIVLKKEVL